MVLITGVMGIALSQRNQSYSESSEIHFNFENFEILRRGDSKMGRMKQISVFSETKFAWGVF